MKDTIKDIVEVEPPKYRLKIRSSTSHKSKLKQLLKPNLIGKTYYFNTTSERLRFVFSIFNREAKIEKYGAASIRRFLNTQGLSRAEIHAVLFNLGFRYKYVSSSYDHNLKNLQVDGYIVPKQKGNSKVGRLKPEVKQQ